jgi:hypothetical protein
MSASLPYASRELLRAMERVIPWAQLTRVLSPTYPEALRQCLPGGEEALARCCLLRQWLNLSIAELVELAKRDAEVRAFAHWNDAWGTLGAETLEHPISLWFGASRALPVQEISVPAAILAAFVNQALEQARLGLQKTPRGTYTLLSFQHERHERILDEIKRQEHSLPPKLKWFLKGLAVTFAAIAILIPVGTWYWLSQVDAGVCMREGRVLDKEELRKAALQSFLDTEIKNSGIWYYEVSRYNSRVGIIENPDETDIWKLMNRAYLRDGTFNENFGIKEFAPRENVHVADFTEPFIFSFYQYQPNGLSIFYVSTEIQIVENPDVKNFILAGKPKSEQQYVLSTYERFAGFGKHYFRFMDVVLNKGCCGNEIPMGWSRERQLENKEETYRRNMAYRDRYPREEFLPVSNCGDILTSSNSQSFFTTYNAKWLRLNENSSDDRK